MTKSHTHKYSPLQLTETEETSSPRTSIRGFIRINSLSFKRKKNSRKKHISNPYGNVYKKRRMSVSCPSSPIGGNFMPISQLLTEVSERLIEEPDDVCDDRFEGKNL